LAGHSCGKAGNLRYIFGHFRYFQNSPKSSKNSTAFFKKSQN